MKKQAIFIFLIAIIVSNFCFAQNYSQLTKSDTITIHSKIFETERKIIVTKSLKIKEEARDNNCIVYMDADDKNINGIFLQSANNLMALNEIPQSYLVGIMQEDRNKELLEKEKLYNFLTEEVIPMLNKTYSISQKITIAGHSFGGYFATYSFLKNNALFNSCIAISPAYWPNEKDVLLMMHDKINTVTGHFYLAVGDKRWDEISLRDYIFDARKLWSNSKTTRFRFTDLEGFSHNATPTVGFGLGLNHIYDVWEWRNILEEQEKRLKSFPGFWGHLEIKGDALCHLNRTSEAKTVYREALKSVSKDEKLTIEKSTELTKRLTNKIQNCP